MQGRTLDLHRGRRGAECALARGGVLEYRHAAPDAAEEAQVERLIGVEVPSRDELRDIEPSSRLYIENGAAYLTASVVWKADSDFAEIADIGFVLAGERLVTIRYGEPKAFSVFAANAHRELEGQGGHDVVTRLIEAMVDRTAEVLEGRSRHIDLLSSRIFSSGNQSNPDTATRDLESMLGVIAGHQRTIAKVRESLMSLSRVAGFLQTLPQVAGDKAIKQRCRSLSRDIQSHLRACRFHMRKTSPSCFDASAPFFRALESLRWQQTQRDEGVSSPPVVFLATHHSSAPVLTAMNFEHMPELSQAMGLPRSTRRDGDLGNSGRIFCGSKAQRVLWMCGVAADKSLTHDPMPGCGSSLDLALCLRSLSSRRG